MSEQRPAVAASIQAVLCPHCGKDVVLSLKSFAALVLNEKNSVTTKGV